MLTKNSIVENKNEKKVGFFWERERLINIFKEASFDTREDCSK